jgi:hypothetical protein
VRVIPFQHKVVLDEDVVRDNENFHNFLNLKGKSKFLSRDKAIKKKKLARLVFLQRYT